MNTRPSIRIIYRAKSHLVIWEVIRAAGIWEELGFEAQLSWEPASHRAEAALFAQEIDFISGNHVTPYLRRAQGKPIFYVAQAYKAADDVLVSRSPVQDIIELRGRVLADRPLLAPDGHLYHPRGDHLLYLRRAGVQPDEVRWLEEDTSTSRVFVDAVADGRADAAFIDPTSATYARELGLSILPLDPLPMILGPTMTGYGPRLRPNPELAEGLIRALAMGLRRFLDDREGTLEVLERDVAPVLGMSSGDGIVELYEKTARNLQPRLYPTFEQVNNAYAIARMAGTEGLAAINPLSVWDLHYIQKLEEEGFFDRLESGKATEAKVS